MPSLCGQTAWIIQVMENRVMSAMYQSCTDLYVRASTWYCSFTCDGALFSILSTVYELSGCNGFECRRKKVHLSTQDTTVISLETGIAVLMMSARHHRETANGHEQWNEFITNVDDSTTPYVFVFDVGAHCKYHVRANELWRKHWNLAKSWRLGRSRKEMVATAGTFICSELSALCCSSAFCECIRDARYRLFECSDVEFG